MPESACGWSNILISALFETAIWSPRSVSRCQGPTFILDSLVRLLAQGRDGLVGGMELRLECAFGEVLLVQELKSHPTETNRFEVLLEPTEIHIPTVPTPYEAVPFIGLGAERFKPAVRHLVKKRTVR